MKPIKALPEKREPSPVPRALVPRLAFSVDEAAESTGLSRTTLYAEMAAGNLHFVKCRSRRVIPVKDLELYLSNLGGAA